jgi:hypothetical protein
MGLAPCIKDGFLPQSSPLTGKETRERAQAAETFSAACRVSPKPPSPVRFGRVRSSFRPRVPLPPNRLQDSKTAAANVDFMRRNTRFSRTISHSNAMHNKVSRGNRMRSAGRRRSG